MSYEVKFDGYVAEVKQFTWGVALKVIHNVRSLNDAGQWETSVKEYVDVVLPVGTNVQPDQRVTVVGKVHQLGAYLTKSGEARPTLKIKASSVTPIENKVAQPFDDLPF
jgi:hypothetical protein